MTGYDAALAALPGVTADAPLVAINAAPVEASGALDNAATVAAPLNGNFGHTVQIPKLLAGRLPAAGAPGEVAVDQNAASQLHLHVGSVLRLVATYNDGSHTRRIAERVTGIFVTTDSVVVVNYRPRRRRSWRTLCCTANSARPTRRSMALT